MLSGIISQTSRQRITASGRNVVSSRGRTLVSLQRNLQPSFSSTAVGSPIATKPTSTQSRMMGSLTDKQYQQQQQQALQHQQHKINQHQRVSPTGRHDQLKQPSKHHQWHGRHTTRHFPNQKSKSIFQQFKDERLSVAQHLDPHGKELPTSTWIHVRQTLPITSLEETIGTFERVLREEDVILDLDADWNPHQDGGGGGIASIPRIEMPSGQSFIEAAHVVLSPFGRPNGWHIKFSNRSMVYAILTRAKSKENPIQIGWKFVEVQEYQYKIKNKNIKSKKKQQHRFPRIYFYSTRNELIVDDTMVRIENVPSEIGTEYIWQMMSRYDLATDGNTVLKWHGQTPDGKVAPTMFIVRFETAAWARAAVREMQSTQIDDKTIKLIQYPKQIRYTDGDDHDDDK